MKNFISAIAILFFCNQIIAQDLENIKNKNAEDVFNRRKLTGFIGDNYQRINILFDFAEKTDSLTYKLTGRSKVKGNICLFEGNLIIDSISYMQTPVNDEVLSYNGFLFGHYSLKELGEKNYCGEFKGTFKIAFRIQQGLILNAIKNITLPKTLFTSFEGTWSNGKVIKQCNWSGEMDYSIAGLPNDFILPNDAADFIVNPKYHSFGWSEGWQYEYDFR